MARNSKKAVKIGVYDFENELAIEDGFHFGYMCIIESMAHLVQSLINSELNHSTIPYCAVELICKSIYSEILNDKKKMISHCCPEKFYHSVSCLGPSPSGTLVVMSV